MNAAEILKELVKLGTVVQDAFTHAKVKDGDLDWKTFFSTIDFAQIEDSVKAIGGKLAQQDVGAALKEVDAKQKALLGGRALVTLSTPELADYSALSRTRLVLATGKLESAMTRTFWQWLVEDALPGLIQLVPKVLALLL